MAWFALYKWFAPWSKIPYINYIEWYRDYLYTEWYNSLSEEEKIKEKQRIENIKKKNAEQLFGILNIMKNMIDDSFYIKLL